MNHSEPEDVPEVHLQDVTEDETLEVAPPANSRKKKLLMIGGLMALLLLTAVGGYFLLSSKEVNVRAVRKTPERVTSGRDLQQAAYDSLRGSLSSTARHCRAKCCGQYWHESTDHHCDGRCDARTLRES